MAAQLLGSTSMNTATNLAWTHRSSAVLTALLALVALAASGCGQKHPTKPGPDAGMTGDAGTSTDGGTSLDGGLGPLPFASDPPNVYVAKVKNVLVGLPPTDAEVQAVTNDPTQLGTLVDGWMALPQYQTEDGPILRASRSSRRRSRRATSARMLDLGPVAGLQHRHPAAASTELRADDARAQRQRANRSTRR